MPTQNLGWENQVENTLQPGVAFNLLANDVDSALAGNVIVDFEADDNLTLTRSQWMTAVLVLTDSGTVLTGAVDVVLPHSFPSMLVVNGTAQTLTLTNGDTDSVSLPQSGSVRISSGPAGVLADPAGGGGSSVWGGITGTLSDQTDLQSALNLKASATGVPIIIETGSNRDVGPADAGSYIRFTGGGAKTATFDDADGFAAAQEFHVTNRAASGNLTLVAAGGMTLLPPKVGTLVLEPGDTVTVKMVDTDEADVFGSMEASS